MPKANLTNVLDEDETVANVDPIPKSVGREVGQVRVAKYFPGKPVPKMENFKTIWIHIDAKPLGGQLSPYVLRNSQGCLLENLWQFAKVYPSITKQRIPLGRWHQDKIIWEHPAERHLDNGIPTEAYWQWRNKGMHNDYAVRYPNGYHGRRDAEFSLWPKLGGDPSLQRDLNDFDQLDYIEARKKIYCALYAELAPTTEHFIKLKNLLASGQNLLICEVDGPDPLATHPPYDQISVEKPGLLTTESNIRLLINDRGKPFGHGYTIAALLLGHSDWLV